MGNEIAGGPAETMEMTENERLCFDSAMHQWERSLKRKDMAERDRVKGALLAYQRQAFAIVSIHAPSAVMPRAETMVRQARVDALEEAAKMACGWETAAAGDDYQTDGNRFWDAGTVYDQGRADAAAAIRALSAREDAG